MIMIIAVHDPWSLSLWGTKIVDRVGLWLFWMHLTRKASGRCWTTIDLVRRGGGWCQRSRFFAWNGATIVIVIVVVATSLPLWQHRYANRSSRRRIWYYLEHSDGQSSGSIEERLGRLMGIRWGGVRTEHGEWEAGIGADHGCFFRCVSWRVKESGTVLSNEVMLRRGGICLCVVFEIMNRIRQSSAHSHVAISEWIVEEPFLSLCVFWAGLQLYTVRMRNAGFGRSPFAFGRFFMT